MPRLTPVLILAFATIDLGGAPAEYSVDPAATEPDLMVVSEGTWFWIYTPGANKTSGMPVSVSLVTEAKEAVEQLLADDDSDGVEDRVKNYGPDTGDYRNDAAFKKDDLVALRRYSDTEKAVLNDIDTSIADGTAALLLEILTDIEDSVATLQAGA